MNERELQQLVETISLKYFKRPFNHRATFNTRLRTTGGRYHLDTHHLDFNPKVLEIFGKEVLIGIIKHELCHYHLHLTNRGYRHRDAEFKALLKEVGGLRYTPSLDLHKGTALCWIYQCNGCEMVIYRKRRFDVGKFVCRECKNTFKLNGRQEVPLNIKIF